VGGLYIIFYSTRSEKMKDKFVFAGIISLALVFGTMAVGCSSNSPTSNITPDLNYSAVDTDMVIVFKDPGRVVLGPGTLYEIYYRGVRVSHGTIAISGADITFKNSKGDTFAATISGDAITFSGNIISDDGILITPPGDFYKEIQTAVPNPFVGVWSGNDGGTVTVTENTWHYVGPFENSWGTYTYIGYTATYWYEGQSTPYVTRLINGTFHTQGTTFSK
jgi:hypothetical protein